MNNPRTRAQKRITRIIIYFYVLLVLMSLFTVASYTWFSLSKTPRVSDMNMYVNAPKGLELSLDPNAPDEDWVLQLDFRDMVPETTPLRPVTWVDGERRFYAAAYGMDGRLMPYEWWQPLNDERNANKTTLDGYYIKATFYARTDTAMMVSLSPAVEVDEGINGSGTYVIGTPVWDAQNIIHNNGGQRAETAVRLGIQITRLGEENEPVGILPEFFIYEPNADLHADGSRGYVATPSIRGNAHLIEEESLITQTASTWREAYPVQRNVVIHELGEFNKDPAEIFEIEVGEVVMIDIYIWLEGQDVDCTNQINDAQIVANIQFSGDAGSQSGLKPIE